MPDARPLLAIVDFADDVLSAPVRRRFESPLHQLRADALAEVIPVLDEADRLARSGLWVVGFVSYDAAPAFDSAFHAARDATMPLACFAAFTGHGVEAPTDDVDAHVVGSVLTSESAVSDGDYDDGVQRVHEHIAAGDVYQVNLTVPFVGSSSLDPIDLYERLRCAQRGRYSAYLDFGDFQIMSASPELFFERHDTTLRTRPMKGTAVRGLDSARDLDARRTLIESEKDRAENVMIVDVARNDVGRIARTGTVRVTSLCDAERYPRVWQLTSTVEGQVEPEIALSRVFSALFPPASITGAPKVRATRIIRALERTARGVYCGAIGLIRPGGDATFNVAIRTAWSRDDGRTVRLSAGGGVTIDSTPAGELAELRAKLEAFTVPAPRPSLFETIRFEHGRPVRLERHLARLSASADYFDLPFDESRAREQLARAGLLACEWPAARCRLVLSPNGSLDALAEPFVDAPAHAPARMVALALEPVDTRDVRIYHKTTERAPYERALSAAGAAFDVLLWNESGEATELSRGNLVAAIAGERFTPPVSCGLLGGTLRAELLESRAIAERVLTLEALRGAERLWFINSLRGWVPITLGD
ncbi:MAG: aminodeoxychorismate synthase component I [bacterium]